jgi:hypothetical protein
MASIIATSALAPFMTMGFLTKDALAGKVEHLYRHGIETFIWVLTWICLRYENDQLLIKDRPLDNWPKEGAIRCRGEKHDFMGEVRHEDATRPTPSHQGNWEIAQLCFDEVALYFAKRPRPVVADEAVFQTFLKAPFESLGK